MTNSKMMIDILAKDQTVVVAKSEIRGDVQRITRHVETFEKGVPTVAAVLLFAGNEIGELIKKGYRERITIIMPEQAIIRAAEAQKAKNNGIEDIGGQLLKPWMVDLEKVTEIEANSWEQALALFGGAVAAYGGQIVWTSARKLYRWKVKGAAADSLADMNGKEVKFTSGANVDFGLIVEENGQYNETVKLTVSAIRDRRGNVRYEATVPRFYRVRNEKGEIVSLDAFTVSNPDLAIEGATDSASAVINGLRLHVRAAEKLPRVNVAKKIVIADA